MPRRVWKSPPDVLLPVPEDLARKYMESDFGSVDCLQYCEQLCDMLDDGLVSDQCVDDLLDAKIRSEHDGWIRFCQQWPHSSCREISTSVRGGSASSHGDPCHPGDSATTAGGCSVSPATFECGCNDAGTE